MKSVIGYLFKLTYRLAFIILPIMLYYCLTNEIKYIVIPFTLLLIIWVSKWVEYSYVEKLKKPSKQHNGKLPYFWQFMMFNFEKQLPNIFILLFFSLGSAFYINAQYVNSLTNIFNKSVVYIKNYILNEAMCHCVYLNEGVDVIGIALYFAIIFFPLYLTYKNAKVLFDLLLEIYKYWKDNKFS